jgi:hypothetical protein
VKPKIIALAAVLAVLGAAIAIVAQRGPGPEPPSPIDPTPFDVALIHASGDSANEGSAMAGAEGSAAGVVTNQTSRETVRANDPPPAEGTGLPVRNGPSVGANPARAGEPVTLLDPVVLREPNDEPPQAGEGTGDPASPFGENDFAAGTITREEHFASHMQQQFDEVSERIARCVEGMPSSTRDTLHVELVVRETVPGTTVGVIENFQTAALPEDRADCARSSFESMDLPLPWLATAIDAPGFTVVADTAVEYSLEIEVEIGAE